MKLFTLAITVALLTASSFAQTEAAAQSATRVTVGRGERVKGSGWVIEDRRDLSGFTAVRVTGPVDLQLKASDRDGVIVRTDDNVAPLIETRVTGGDRPALEIGVRTAASFRTKHAPVVIVEFRTLSELVLRGSGRTSADRITTEDFALSMNGSGDTRIDAVQVTRFAAVVAGSGDLTVRGQADQVALQISGSGDADARGLESRTVQVAIAGSGDVAVNASESLTATIAGSGDVTYWGRPQVAQSVRGSGTVRRAR